MSKPRTLIHVGNGKLVKESDIYTPEEIAAIEKYRQMREAGISAYDPNVTIEG